MNIYILHTNPEELDDFDQIMSKKPYWAFDVAVANPNLKQRMSKFFADKGPQFAYEYATRVIGRRFPELESEIAKDPKYSLWYALYSESSPKRFLEGEPAIAKSARHAYDYAEMVMKGRFPAGELEIAKSPEFAYRYILNVIGIDKGWPEGEAAIKKNPDLYEKYLKIKRQFLGDKL